MFCEKMLFFDARIRLAGLNRIKPVISHRVNHFGSGNKCIPLTTLPPSLPSKSTRSEYLYLFVGQWGVIAVAVSNHFLTSFPACSALSCPGRRVRRPCGLPHLNPRDTTPSSVKWLQKINSTLVPIFEGIEPSKNFKPNLYIHG